MTAPFFSSVADQKIFTSIGLSSTAYTFGCRFFVSGTVGSIVRPILDATTRDAESAHIRPLIGRVGSAHTYILFQDYSLGPAQWRFTASDNAWHSIFIVHDRASLTPTPIVYIDRVTAAVATTSAAAGTPVMPSATAGYIIGKRAGVGTMFRGFLQHVVWANALWTKAECDQFASAPGSVMRSVEFYYPFAREDHNVDYGGLSHALSSSENNAGPAAMDSTASGGLRRAKLLRVGL